MSYLEYVAIELAAYATDENRLVYLVAVARKYHSAIVVFEYSYRRYRVFALRIVEICCIVIFLGRAVKGQTEGFLLDYYAVGLLVGVFVYMYLAVFFAERRYKEVGIRSRIDYVLIVKSRNRIPVKIVDLLL